MCATRRAMTVSLIEVKAKAAQCLSEGLSNPAKFSAKLLEFFNYGFDHFESMDGEAKAYFEHSREGLIDLCAEQINRIPDGRHRRNLARSVAMARGRHLKAENLARSLSGPPTYKFPIIQKAEPIFFSLLQSLLDVLHDATEQSHSGAARFATIALHFWVVDELQVAFHLAQRKYATQAYSHMRTVFDLLEKIELFHKYPKWAEVWASEDKKAIREELSPAAVRTKLGQAKFNPVYSFFSEVGIHGTFQGVQGRVSKRRKDKESEGIAVSMWVGGIPREDQVVFSISSCIFTAVSALLTAFDTFQDHLNEEDVREIIEVSIKQATKFLKEHFVGWAREAGFDVTELLEVFRTEVD
jgi:hypothetical protein